MLTKRMMFRAGALALALSVAACSEDRAGGATGVSETAGAAPSVPPVNPPAPAAIATPATPEAVRPGDGGMGGGDGVVTVISSSTYEGHQVVLSEVTTSSGAKVKRVSLDGVTMVDFSDDMAGDAPTAATAYADGQVFLQETVNFSAVSSIVIPPQYLGLTAPMSGGPQLQAALPCMHEMALFGGASLWLSGALMWAKVQPFNIAAWIDLRLAVTAVGAASYNLYLCLRRVW